MTVIQCKVCGGDVKLSEDKTIGTCEYCGTTITLPKIDDDQRAARFNRGNHFRMAGEFDKALSVYESIVDDDDSDAEAHWNCVLCRFGIEYVEDPATYEYIPTCHRASFDSILEDVDYKAALAHSEGITRRQYMKDAAKIAEVQKGILATSQNEEPFDVFISYKEMDDSGKRTVDATLAQDIYYRLTDKGYRVFFSRITLEGKPGTEYEPYIFAALNSSKVMVLVGTSAENINSAWVKNEWSRFLTLRKKDRSKLLIPCYRDMDPYDLPDKLNVLKAYDMGQIVFIQDLIHGIEKVLNDGKPQGYPGPAAPAQPQPVVQPVVTGGTNIKSLLDRGQMALEDKEWGKANDFFEQVLNQDARCAEGYLGELLARERESTMDELFSVYENKYAAENDDPAIRKNQKAQQLQELQNDRLFARILQFAAGDFKVQLDRKLSRLTVVLDKRISDAEAKEAKKESEKQKLHTDLSKAEKEIEDLEQQIKEKKQQQAALGLFKGKEKKEIQSQIDRLNAELSEKRSNTQKLQNEISFKFTQPGKTLFFGNYKQGTNAQEPIEWLVLDKTDSGVLLISKYALDCQPYNTVNTSVTWETCTLWSWLNNNFYHSAFTKEEQEMIRTATVAADPNPDHSKDPGNATQDKVFLLSINEVNKYFTSDAARQCRPTEVAVANGVYKKTDNGNCWWWLRSPGYNSDHAAYVFADGSVSIYGLDVNYSDGAVRPALWVQF